MKLAIFNGFHFHYEMFGSIINFCNMHNHELIVYTELTYNYNWFAFYKEHFTDVNCDFRHYTLFENEKDIEKFDLVIVTTDDDYKFKEEWITENVMCIEHDERTRRHTIVKRMSTKPHIKNYRKWGLPTFPIVDTNETLTDNEYVNIVILGQTDPSISYDINVINRLHHPSKKIVIHAVSRYVGFEHYQGIRDDIFLKIYRGIDTFDMIKLLKSSDYIFTDNKKNINMDHYMSGAIPLSFSVLVPLIISKQTNNSYCFRNVIEFDKDTNNPINLLEIDKNYLRQERKELIDIFNSHIQEFILNKNSTSKFEIPKNIYQTWDTKELTPYFYNNVSKWEVVNPEYQYKLFDINEVTEVVSLFGPRYINVFNRFIPSAFKCDLWRYIMLFLYGGVATDLDMIPVNNIDSFIREQDFMVTVIDLNLKESEGFHNLSNGFLAIVPRHPIMFRCINRICELVENNLSYLSLMDISGPGNLGRAVNWYLGRNETDSFVSFTHNNIHFLTFDRKDEYIYKNNSLIYENILVQNKNGNTQMINEYNLLCYNNKNHKSWIYNKPYN
jgi:mannosyltransferase OCH1-like enzyme